MKRINYTGSSKIIKRLCERVNEINVKLGRTHNDAFYGDLGQEAYEHAQLTSGNPHHVTAEDLGLDGVRDQITALMIAFGAQAPWGCHGDNNEDYIVDHDGVPIVFQTDADVLAWH